MVRKNKTREGKKKKREKKKENAHRGGEGENRYSIFLLSIGDEWEILKLFWGNLGQEKMYSREILRP